ARTKTPLFLPAHESARRTAARAVYDCAVEDAYYGEPDLNSLLAEGDPEALRATAEQVSSIVGAAERTAERMRETAEARAQERIAEADRAVEIRVQAA